jgi:NADH dehydrogenase FAD-containing subunit
VLLCVLAPPILSSGVTPDRFEVLLLLAATGAGWASLDGVAAGWAALRSRMVDRSGEPLPHVVVVGGGFGGIAAVHALRWTACRITLIDRRNHYLFQPLLYQVATAALSPADIAIPIRSVLREQRNVSVRLGEVIGIDRAARSILLPEQRIPFDYLVLATGAQHSYFGRDEWAPHAPGLKSIEDATAMRSRMLLAFERAESEADPAKRQAWLTFVVVGGGPAGVELAGALSELAHTGLDQEYRAVDPATVRVILVQSASRVLPAFSATLSAHADRSLRELGVEVRTGAKVTLVDHEGVEIDGSRIAAKTAFWAAGVAASPAAKWLGQTEDRSGRVVVEGDLSVRGWPGAFAIGDTSASTGWAGAAVPGLAPAAKQQGRHAARVIRAAIDGSSPPGAFRCRHYGNLATIGRLAAVVEHRKLRLWGAPAWWLWGLAHVLLLAGGRNRATVVLNWLWAYLTYRHGTRLITRNTMDT